MKKTQIVLGLSAFVLAIAGAFATKANTNLAAIQATLVTANQLHCEGAVLATCQTIGTQKCRTVNNGIQTLRTKNCTQTLAKLGS